MGERMFLVLFFSICFFPLFFLDIFRKAMGTAPADEGEISRVKNQDPGAGWGWTSS